MKNLKNMNLKINLNLKLIHNLFKKKLNHYNLMIIVLIIYKAISIIKIKKKN